MFLLKYKKYAGAILRSLGILLFASNIYAESSAEALLAGDQAEHLDEAIAFYAGLKAQGGWELLPQGGDLVAGMREARVRTLRRRLRLTGDFDDERMSADPLLFDSVLTEAVMNFQRRHGLTATGVADRMTQQRMRLTPEQLLAQLEDSRTRISTLPELHTGRRVWVNIPEAQVAVINAGKIEFILKAIVGHPTRPTPELSSIIRRIVVNPAWGVPRSIAVNDVLPRQQQDGSYLTRNRIRIYSGWGDDEAEIQPQQINWSELNNNNFPYHLRQDPGPANSLGRYKFDFPNSSDVYLHDTPGRSLLNLSYRTLSSGCVRVQDSQRLASWLAMDGATELLVKAESLQSSQAYSVPLQRPVPVDLVYLTAWVAPKTGTVQFRFDIYGLNPVM